MIKVSWTWSRDVANDAHKDYNEIYRTGIMQLVNDSIDMNGLRFVCKSNASGILAAFEI